MASVSSFASDKICFGTGDSKGNKFTMSLEALAVTLVGADNPDIIEGSFKRTELDVVKGRDGKTYLDFYMGNIDGALDLLVDETLLENGTTASVKIRSRGESFNSITYICRDKTN